MLLGSKNDDRLEIYCCMLLRVKIEYIEALYLYEYLWMKLMLNIFTIYELVAQTLCLMSSLLEILLFH